MKEVLGSADSYLENCTLQFLGKQYPKYGHRIVLGIDIGYDYAIRVWWSGNVMTYIFVFPIILVPITGYVHLYLILLQINIRRPRVIIEYKWRVDGRVALRIIFEIIIIIIIFICDMLDRL